MGYIKYKYLCTVFDWLYFHNWRIEVNVGDKSDVIWTFIVKCKDKVWQEVWSFLFLTMFKNCF